MGTVQSTFESIWGQGRKEPYAYQLEVAERLLSGRNVVLLAPTGSGKTVSALLPFVHARMCGMAWADRLIYALPLRTLTTALHTEYRDDLLRAGLRSSLQTGLLKGDPVFRSDVCFTTIDQLLSAYVGDPVSVSPRQANVCGGALVGAYVVFDEFHLLEPQRALATVLDLGARLAGICSVLIMTATATEYTLKLAQEYLSADLVVPSAEDLKSMPAESTRMRFYRWREESLTADQVFDAFRRAPRGRVVAVVNTVKRAQELYQAVVSGASQSVEVIGLHSHFLSADRAAKERRALELFKQGDGGQGVLIATQVVEVGLNISCDCLLTEVAPANSLVQRAGRCARFAGETGEVQVFDYSPETDNPWAPYPQEHCDRTRSTLRELVGSGLVKSSFEWERELVEKSLGELDRQALHLGVLAARRDEIRSALTSDATAAYRRYVRDIDSSLVIIEDEPWKLDLSQGIEGVSVSASTLAGFLRSLDLQGEDAGTVHVPEWGEGIEAGQEPEINWVQVSNSRDAMARPFVAVSWKVATYDSAMGLRLGRGAQNEQPGSASRSIWVKPVPRQEQERKSDAWAVPESFRHHAMDVGARARNLALAEGRAAVARLAVALRLPQGFLLDLVELTGCLHDSGKLDRRWQALVREQAHLDPAQDPGSAETILCVDDSRAEERLFLAHSAYRHHPRRPPPHAVAGAALAYQLCWRGLEDLLPPEAAPVDSPVLQLAIAALVAAVARHHHAGAVSGDEFVASSGAREQLAKVLPVPMAPCAHRVDMEIRPQQMEELMRSVAEALDPSERPESWALYWFLARLVRLADQESQEALKTYGERR